VARHRPAVPVETRRSLVEEAGNKCANPGCVSFRTHLHHIEEWAVYESHDAEHMIAVCPTCHDAIHNGPLAVDDDTLYRWTEIERTATTRDHLYVEPGEASKLLLGTIAVTGRQGVTVFDLGNPTKLSFRLADEDVMLLDLAVATTRGDEVLRVVDGHVRRQATARVGYESVPGHIRVTAPISDEFVPVWAIQQLRLFEPEFGAQGSLPLLDLEVLEPGLVRVQGVWHAAEHVVIAITPQQLAFLQPGLQRPLSFIGDGPESLILFDGPITAALFGIGEGPGSALTIPLAPPPQLRRNDPCWCGSGKKFKKCHGP
jgi:SEC-C motif/HNH endonuclease